ncbi:MAG: IclR family transcriptional regulator [Methylobacteriaceae bacterium]|nr:IclR family transcriptional regulator [Methylobacteriaceae bacterium]
MTKLCPPSVMVEAADQYLIKPVLGAFSILEAIARAGEACSLQKLAVQCGVSKATAFRHVRTLGSLGYVRRAASAGYELGPAVLAFTGDDARERALRALIEPELIALHRRFGETVNLGTPKGRRIHYLLVVDGASSSELRAEVGDADHFHCTALGKAMLAFMAAGDAAAHLNRQLQRVTDRTITERRRLEAELRAVRQRGYATDFGENEAGCICFAAPIFDAGRRPIAAISVSMRGERLTDRLDVEIPDALVTLTHRLSELIAGGRADAVLLKAGPSGRGRTAARGKGSQDSDAAR